MGRREGQLESKRITHSIDYTVHSIHAIGTWYFKSGTYVVTTDLEARNAVHVLKIIINKSNIRIRRAIVTDDPVRG